MGLAAEQPMTVDTFLAWAMARPEGERYELLDGRIVAMSPETNRHNLVKTDVFRVLDDLASRCRCTVLQDGATVVVDDTTVFEPDVTVQCGGTLDPDATTVEAPTLVVEVLSPSSAAIDTSQKLEGYARIASLRHYLIVDPRRRSVIHHAIAEGALTTRILREGPLALPPLGEVADVRAFFASLRDDRVG
ncbi:MAG: Uma2 family endonuclease [Pseudomonadota bacterium]